MKQANDRYSVAITGTPDIQGSEYVVLNLVGDYEARVAVAKLARRYEAMGAHSHAKALQDQLAKSTSADEAFYEKRNAAMKKTSKATRGRKRTNDGH